MARSFSFSENVPFPSLISPLLPSRTSRKDQLRTPGRPLQWLKINVRCTHQHARQLKFFRKRLFTNCVRYHPTINCNNIITSGLALCSRPTFRFIVTHQFQTIIAYLKVSPSRWYSESATFAFPRLRFSLTFANSSLTNFFLQTVLSSSDLNNNLLFLVWLTSIYHLCFQSFNPSFSENRSWWSCKTSTAFYVKHLNFELKKQTSFQLKFLNFFKQILACFQISLKILWQSDIPQSTTIKFTPTVKVYSRHTYSICAGHCCGFLTSKSVFQNIFSVKFSKCFHDFWLQVTKFFKFFQDQPNKVPYWTPKSLIYFFLKSRNFAT